VGKIRAPKDTFRGASDQVGGEDDTVVIRGTLA
jgi:hypothetical protein